MNKTVVIFESKYGFTKRYARWLSESLSCPLFEKKAFQTEDFAKYDTVIFGGGLYAGGVSGIRLLIRNRSVLSGKQVILFTVGLADPADPDNLSHIRQSLSKVLPGEMMDSIKTFHLRGGICYSELNLLHKTMMGMLRRMLLKKAPADLGSEDRLLLDTYGKSIDFTDRRMLDPLIDHVKKKSVHSNGSLVLSRISSTSKNSSKLSL